MPSIKIRGKPKRSTANDHEPKEDPTLRWNPAYLETRIDHGIPHVCHIEVNATGNLVALVDVFGTITIYENVDEEWRRMAAWRFKCLEQPSRQSRRLANHSPFVTSTRPKIIVRWSLAQGKLLAVAVTNRDKVHVFGENFAPPIPDRTDAPFTWHRRHSMTSAANITEMRFSPSHLEFSLVTATCTGMVVIHLIQDPSNPRTWRPIHAISVFRGQPITSLTWNQNPVHELPILVASTNGLDAREDRRIAVFAINSPSVRPETNMCFEASNTVNCVSFAPSIGLNDSLLAVGVGRRICLYMMNVEEFQVPDHMSPPGTSEQGDESVTFGSGSDSNTPNSTRASSAVIDIERSSLSTETPSSLPSYMQMISSLASFTSDSSPILPAHFFSETNSPRSDSNGVPRRDIERESQLGDEDSTDDDEEEEQDPAPLRRALMWNVKWKAVFREAAPVRSIQWGQNPSGFTAQFVDGNLRSYKWSFGCVWTKSAVVYAKRMSKSTI